MGTNTGPNIWQTPERAFLDYVNNFLTVIGMSQYYGVDYNYLLALIEQGRKDHYLKHEKR